MNHSVKTALFFTTITTLLLVVVLLFIGCVGEHEKANYHTIDGFALGTTYRIIVEQEDTTGLQSDIDLLLAEANSSMSLYDKNSLLSRLNRGETDSLDKHISYCIELAQRVSVMSEGMYDITIKPLSEAWGFIDKEAQAEPNIDSLIQYVGYEKIAIRSGRLVKEQPQIQLDLNSIAKGYIVDLMGMMIQERGSQNYMVEVGGEIYCKGVNSRGVAWVVGVDRPVDNNIISGADLQIKLSLAEQGLATSGNYRKFYYNDSGQKVVHTINPLTGESIPSDLLSATVIAENCATADALATMLMAVGLERAKSFLNSNPQYLGLLIYSSEKERYETFQTDGFKRIVVE